MTIDTNPSPRGSGTQPLPMGPRKPFLVEPDDPIQTEPQDAPQLDATPDQEGSALQSEAGFERSDVALGSEADHATAVEINAHASGSTWVTRAKAIVDQPTPGDVKIPPVPKHLDGEVVWAPHRVFRGFNPKAAAFIFQTPSIEAVIDHLVRYADKLRAKLAWTAKEIIDPSLPGKAWTVLGRLYLAALWLVWTVVVSVGAFFILDFLAHMDPTLAYVGVGIPQVVAALSLACASFIGAGVFKRFDERWKAGIMLIAFIAGLPLFLIGLVQLMAQRQAGDIDFGAAFGASGSGAPQIPLAYWLMLRLAGEFLLVLALKMHIDGFIAQHQGRRANPECKKLQAEINLVDNLIRRLDAKLQERNALLNRYAGAQSEYIQSVFRACDKVSSITVHHVSNDRF